MAIGKTRLLGLDDDVFEDGGAAKTDASNLNTPNLPLRQATGNDLAFIQFIDDSDALSASIAHSYSGGNIGVNAHLSLSTVSQSQTGAVGDGSQFVISRTITSGAAAPVAGFENAAAAFYSTVGPLVKPYETTLVLVMANGSNQNVQNSAAHFRALKSGSSATWGLAMESQDETGLSNPTAGLHLIEGVIAGSGADTNHNRVGLDIIASRPLLGTPTVYTGTAAEIGYGLRFVNQVADSGTQNKFRQAISVQGYVKEAGVNTSLATIDNGMAYVMGSGQSFSMTATFDRTWDYGFGSANYRVSGSPKFQIADDGTTNQTGPLQIGGVQVMTSRRPGWSAATGTATRTTFDTATVTTAQLAERLKALIDDLIAGTGHGAIGA